MCFLFWKAFLLKDKMKALFFFYFIVILSYLSIFSFTVSAAQEVRLDNLELGKPTDWIHYTSTIYCFRIFFSWAWAYGKSARGSENLAVSLRAHIKIEITFLALAYVAQLVGALSRNQRVAGLIPGPGTYLGCRSDPQSRCVREATNQYFSPTSMFLSLLSSLPSSLSKSIEKSPGWCSSPDWAQAANQRVAHLIPSSQGTCLSCGPGPQWGPRWVATTYGCFSSSFSLSLPLSLKINK